MCSEPHASNELVDLPEDLPLSGEEQGDIDAKPAPMLLKRHEGPCLKMRTARRQRWEAASPTVADMKDRERAIETRSGRKGLLLIETLRQAREKVPAHDVVVALRPASAAAMPLKLELCMRDTRQSRSVTCWPLRSFRKKTAETSVLRAWFWASWCSRLSQLLVPLPRESGRLLALWWTATW